MEVTAQQEDSFIAGRMECVTVNIMWKALYSKWTVVLQVEWSVLQWTLCGKHCTASGQWYCRLNGVCYSEQYVECTAHQEDSDTWDWMECVTVNIMWNLLHSRSTVKLKFEWSVLRWALCGCNAQLVVSVISCWMDWITVNFWAWYCTACVQFYCRLIGLRYSEHFVEGTAQHMDSCFAGWMEWFTLNYYVEFTARQFDSVIAAWKRVLQWTIFGSYCTAGGHCKWRFNRLCYSEHYVQDTAHHVECVIEIWFFWYIEHYVESTTKQLDSVIASWMEWFTVNIMWKLLHSRWTVVLQVEWSMLQWTLCRSYCKLGGNWYCNLNWVCYSEQYV